MQRSDTLPVRRDVAEPRPASSADEAESETRDRLASWALRGRLTVVLGGLCLLQLATWVPHYLTWPYWADHDAYATMARGWDLGRLPYRDLRCNNFPGQVYLFWILGKAAGWGKIAPFYAVDAAMVATLGIALAAWSKRRLAMVLPGVAGYLVFLTYYLGLDYSHAAQRDWQGPFFVVVGLLILQAWPGRASRFASALACALAVTFRPQTVLLLPVVALEVSLSAHRPGESLGRSFRALVAWGLIFAAFLALAFVPLIAAGVGADFVRGVRNAAYGSRYNKVTPVSVAKGWLTQVMPLRVTLVPLAIALLAPRTSSETRRTAFSWGLALACVSLYKPLSPLAHSYLDTPLMLIWAINLAVLVRLVLEVPWPAPRLQLVAVLTIVSLATTIRPEFCEVGPTARAFAALRRGGMPEEAPPGYWHGTVPSSAYYPWRDYRALINYLRNETAPGTLVANVLKGDPAVTAPADRLSAFPAESISWLRLVRRDDEADFAASLESARNSVVVWSPGEEGLDPTFTLEILTPTIRKLYEPEAKFGVIEVWRRRKAG